MESNRKMDKIINMIETSEKNKLFHMRLKEWNKQKNSYLQQLDTYKTQKWQVQLNPSVDPATKSTILSEIDKLIEKKELDLDELASKEPNEEYKQTENLAEKTPKRKNIGRK